MNRTNSFRSLTAAAMATLAAGALSFTSCETFDDSDILSSLDDLNSRVEALETALNSLQGDVDASSGLLAEGKVIKSVTPNADGTQYTITYVGEDAKSDVITVGTGDPVITILNEGGVYYWAKINADGEAEHILDSDNKIPVLPEKVEIPDQVAPTLDITEDGKLQVSIDNGSTWTDTGVQISDIYVPTFSSVVPGNGSVVFTLQDGTSFEVPRTVELVCEFISGKTYFDYGETLKLAVNASGYEKYELVAPNGWEAAFDGSVVTVTAPYEVSAGVAASGDIVLRVYADGDVYIDKVSVAVGEEAGISIAVEETKDAVNVKVTVGGTSVYCGVMKASEFTAEAAAALAASEMDLPDYDDYGNPVEGDYKFNIPMDSMDWSTGKGILTKPFSDFVEAPSAGEQYVIWAVDTWQEDEAITAEDVYTYVYAHASAVETKVENVTFCDADITITPAGQTEYYYGVAEYTDYFDPEFNILMSLPETVTSGEVKTTLSEIAEMPGVWFTIEAGRKYVVWTIVKKADINDTDYTVEDIVMQEFTLKELTYDGTAQVKFGEVEATHNSVSVTVTAPENAHAVYGMYAGADMVAGMTNEQIRNDLMYNSELDPDDLTIEGTYLNAETKGWIFAVVVDNDGKVGPLTKIEANTTAVVRNETITIKAGQHSFSKDGLTLTVPLTITGEGAETVVYYNKTADSDWYFYGEFEAIDAAVASDPSHSSFSRVPVSELVDGALEIPFYSYTAAGEYNFYAYVIDADGHVTSDYAHITYTFTPPTR